MEGWRTTTIDDACNIEYGTRVVQKRDGGSIYPVYGGGGATFFMDTSNRVNRVVVSRFGMSELCTRYVEGEFFLNDSGLTLAPRDTNVLLPEFLDRVVLALNDEIFALGKGAAQKNLDVPAFRALRFSYPASLPEQRRIVAILDEAFEAIATAKANTEKNLQNARELIGSYLRTALEDVQGGWQENTLEHLCIIGDGNHSSNYPTKDELVEFGVPFIRATNLVAGRISGSDMRFLSPEKHAQLKKGHLKAGDILITNRGEIGKTALVDDAYDGSNLNSQIAWLRCRDMMHNRFLFHVLNSEKIQSHFQSSKSGAALQQFTIKQLKALRVPSPPLPVQELLADRLDNFAEDSQGLRDVVERKLVALDELKKSILHRAFTGQLSAKSTDQQLEAAV